ncbi:MAG: transglycosylase SLT domain-containing protein [bacterium]|nr:transglycosylase SLT domain-containing protein [bacterium]
MFKQTDAQGRTFLNVNFIGPYIVGLYKYLVGIGGIAAGIMFVWAGVKWLTSAGNAEGIGDAKKKIGGASVGLVLLLGSYVVLKLVNPELVIFKPLQVEFVDPELLEEFEEKDLETETFAPAMSIGDTTYDEIFQSFANCTPADWRFLKAIAYKESGLNTNKVNPSNYIGLFQTKQANCEDALKGYPQHQSACADLTNPSVNTAVGALMMRSALQKIRGKCASASTLEKLTMVYINHNMGPAVLRYAMDVGCTLPQLKQGSINYYTSNERGKRTAQNYASKYQPACLQEKTPAECTAVPKFDYSVSTARATQGLGVSKIEAPATGPCPLSSAEPF